VKRIAFLALLLASACASPIAGPDAGGSAIPPPPEGNTPSVADVVAASKPEEWRALDPENTLYMDFPQGRVVIEMASDFSPNHVANVKALSREGFFVNGAVTRVQDNFVTQWAPETTDPPREPKVGKATLPAEFWIPRSSPIEFTRLPDSDTFAPEVGFSKGFPVASDGSRMWLAHCYGIVGAGRDVDVNSGGGTELYTVIGQAPRAIDRQLSMVGRVVQGMEILSSFPRGTGDAGFYKTPEEYQHYADIKVAADVPEAERTNLEVMRTDSESFATMVNARRWRRDGFYTDPIGRIGICNVNVPVRPVAK